MSKQNKELKNLSPEELKAKVAEYESQIFKLKMQKATGQLDNPMLIRETRKQLARAKTYYSQKTQAI